MSFAPIPELLEEIRNGRMVVIVDDEDRENEGDLIMAAELVRPADINFMVTHARGLVCLSLTRERCAQLGLAPMVQANTAQFHTNFTVSIEAAEGVTTGISAYDRAHTIRTAVRPDAKPRVVFKDIDGEKCEPYENLTIDLEDENQGAVMEELGRRRGELTNMESDGNGRTRLEYHIPARGLIGFQSDFLTMTRGSGLMSHIFDDYKPVKPDLPGRHNGVLVSQENGEAVAYALWNLEDRGRMFVSPGDKLYEGMIIGIHSRENDLVVNPIKGKQLTNVRSSGTDEAVRLVPPIQMSLEYAVEFIEDDELVEITPKSIRLRKRFLKEHERKKASRDS